MNHQLMLLTEKASKQEAPSDLMEFFILLILGLMILICVSMFVIGLVQKAKRRNDGLAKKTKLLEMYEAEEKKKAAELKKKEEAAAQAEEKK